MKVSNSSAGKESGTSPTMKKLKQARLPFKIIASDEAKSVSPPSKKRKLSEEHEEAPNKVVKQTVEEKNVETMVISDDEESNNSEPDKSNESRNLNPYVSLVDVALKRKLKKKTTPLKKKTKKVHVKETECHSIAENYSKNSESETSLVKEDKKEAVETDILVEDKEEQVTVDRIENKENIDEVVYIDESSNNSELNEQNNTTNEKSISKLIEKSNFNSKGEENCSKKDIPHEVSEGINEVEINKEISSTKDNADEITASPPKEEIKNVDNKSENSDSESSEGEISAIEDEKVSGETSDASSHKSPERNKNESGKDSKTPRSNKKQIISDEGTTSSAEKSIKSPRTPSLDNKQLTPKQIQKKLESLKKQQEREKEKQERDKKKQEEKEERNRQRIEKEEQKKKEREEKEEQKKKEREEKEKQKELEKKEKEEKEEAKRKEKEEKELQKKREKEVKEEERKKKELEKEEEKRKKELEKEEAEIKKKKAAAAFVNFFVPKASGSKDTKEQQEDIIKHEFLSNFTKKSDMRLAPLNRNPMDEARRNMLDEHLEKQELEKNELLIANVTSKDYEIKTNGKTWPSEEMDNDVMIVEDELPIDSLDIVPEDSHKQKMRAKLLSFSENQRPPYWGTWRKKSTQITGRRPFVMDRTILDYSCDSDEEWEEEEPGESVGGSVVGSDDEEGDNDYDVDNEFMVPHGYLSEEEAMGEEDDQVLSPESQKAKLKIMQCEFENEMKKNTEKLHPRLIGIIWQHLDGNKPDSCKESVWNFLCNRKILAQEEQIFIQPTTLVNECEPEDVKNEKPAKKSRKITDAMIPDLIRLVHGNTNGRGFLAHEFQIFISKSAKSEDSEQKKENTHKSSEISKMSVAKKIKEISTWMSCPEEGVMCRKRCWFVTKDIREKYNVDIELPNKWTYALTPKRQFEKKKEENKTPLQTKTNPEQNKSEKKEPVNERKEGTIAKFTKIMTQEEKEKQFIISNPVPSTSSDDNASKKVDPATDKNSAPNVKKRVPLLFSGPIGKSLPSSSNDNKTDDTKQIDKSTKQDQEKIDQNNSPTKLKSNQSNLKAESKPVQESSKGKSDGTKKRVPILISVPKEQEIPKSIKTNLLTQFIKTIHNDNAKKDEQKKAKNVSTPMETDDCVVLSD